MYILKTDICNEQNNEIVPQVLDMGYGYDYYAEDSVSKIIYNKPLDFLPNLKSFHLDPETSVTDIIRQGYIFTAGLLVSNPLYESIKNFVLQPYEAYEAEVVYQDACLNYYWIHITKILEGEIDFEKSEFIQSDPKGNNYTKKFLNQEDLDRKCKELVFNISGKITAKKIIFIPETPLYDLFFIRLTSDLIFISERMKDCLLRNQFTGFEIMPSSVLF